MNHVIFVQDWRDLITGRNEVLAKVIFSQASVCPRGWGVVWVTQHALQVSPGGVWSGGGPPICRGVSNFGERPPIFRGVSNFFGGVSNFLRGGGGSPTPEYGQRSAGTHPTGMHFCLRDFSTALINFLIQLPNCSLFLNSNRDILWHWSERPGGNTKHHPGPGSRYCKYSQNYISFPAVLNALFKPFSRISLCSFIYNH